MRNDFFRLPVNFNVSDLLHDLRICEENVWKNHFNRRDYEGRWTSIALRSLSGNTDDINAHAGIYSDTPLLAKCIYFRKVIAYFECEKESVRLMNLAPGSVIKSHTDRDCGYQHGILRIHIPILTSEDVYFIVNNTNLIMNPGECWYADFSLPHSVRNEGKNNRIHLVIDGKRNAWTDKLFEKAGYNFEQEYPKQEYNSDVKLRIIQELENLGTETGQRIIEELRNGG
jgi:hypothetical protein